MLNARFLSSRLHERPGAAHLRHGLLHLRRRLHRPGQDVRQRLRGRGGGGGGPLVEHAVMREERAAMHKKSTSPIQGMTRRRRQTDRPTTARKRARTRKANYLIGCRLVGRQRQGESDPGHCEKNPVALKNMSNTLSQNFLNVLEFKALFPFCPIEKQQETMCKKFLIFQKRAF